LLRSTFMPVEEGMSAAIAGGPVTSGGAVCCLESSRICTVPYA
jgi:hypothetical protein